VQGLEIRRAAAEDAEAIARVHLAAWRETYAGLLPAKMLARWDLEARSAMWARVLLGAEATSARTALVLERGGRLVGFGACGDQRAPALRAAGYDGEVDALYLLDEVKGRGAGRALMQGLAKLLAARGKSGLGLWVLRENLQARGFYERLGGLLAGARTDVRPEALLQEVAYGWRDLSVFGR
jgi:ribosomal protein S18 acetylase RimI-like enzyme